MDRNVSTAVKNGLFGTTWKSDINNLTSLKDKLVRVKQIEIFLPYAAYQEYQNSNLEFIFIDEENHKIFDRRGKRNSNYPHYISYMVLFLRDDFNKQTLGIELSADVEVIPQKVTRKKWYYYEWNKHKLTIRRILGTYDTNKIEKMIHELMNEFNRFYLMYCNTK